MDSQIIYLALAVLAFAVALNLQLTISALHAARAERNAAEPLLAGDPVPPVVGRPLDQWAVRQVVTEGQPVALLFLSSRCPKCRSKLAELEQMLPAARGAGLAVRLISREPAWRLRRFLDGRFPLPQVLRLSQRDYKLLNATGASPAYLFVNHEGILEASGLIGDENWLGLRAQLTDNHVMENQAA
jgi:peroxiredoxin